MAGFFARLSYCHFLHGLASDVCVYFRGLAITISARPSDLLVYGLLGLSIPSFMSLINSMLCLHYVTVWKWLHKARNRLAGCSIRVSVKHDISVTSCFLLGCQTILANFSQKWKWKKGPRENIWHCHCLFNKIPQWEKVSLDVSQNQTEPLALSANSSVNCSYFSRWSLSWDGQKKMKRRRITAGGDARLIGRCVILCVSARSASLSRR